MFRQLNNPQFFSLIESCKKGTQKYILAEIFSEKKGEWITKREVEKQMVLRWCLKEIDNHTKFTKNEIITRASYVDKEIYVYFINKFKKYGLERMEKNKSSIIDLIGPYYIR